MTTKHEWLGFGAAVAGMAIWTMAAGCSNSTPSLTGIGGGGGSAGGGHGGAAGNAGAGGASAAVDGGVTGAGGAAGAGGGAATDAGTDGGNPPPVCALPTATAGTWAEIAPPAGQTNFRVTDAFAAGANDLFFAGVTRDQVNPPSNPRVLRWEAGCWTVELTIPSTSQALTPSVNGTSASDVWATGGDLLFHRDAQGWTRFADESWRNMVRQPPSFAGPLELNRVRAVAPNQIWVAATNNMLRWDGQAWTAFNFDDPGYPNDSASVGYFFKDIWIDSPASVWVASASDQVGNTMDQGFVHHFDGASWTRTAVGVGGVQSIWHAGAPYWLAMPTLDTVNGQQVSRTLRRFDGTSAPTVDIAGASSVFLQTLFGRGASDVWASGADVAHFDGQGWSLVSDAPAAARGASDDSNTFVTGDATSVWLSTPGPRFFRKAD